MWAFGFGLGFGGYIHVDNTVAGIGGFGLCM